MRLPRRVPWASIGELDQVCSWIYTDECDYDSKTLAVHRLSAWKAITALPHALESTLSLLVVVTHDNPHSQLSNLSLRQSYATAIIRLVNGLVDPLQLGAYARSIASIAEQLGLPPWLVELRHAATHEELPSLSLLREAARQSLSWLLQNYFLPTINPQSESSSSPPPLRPLKPVLKQYKECMKIVSRDASLAPKHKLEILASMRAIERWIAEAAVATNVSFGEVGWATAQASDSILTEQDAKERWALERLCDGLLEKGALVPLSKKKRTFPSDAFLPPNNSIAIWASLLQFIQKQHGGFALVLGMRVCAMLGNPESWNQDQVDPSYLSCLSRWVKWLVDSFGDSYHELREEIVTQLLQDLGHVLPLPQPKQSKYSALELARVLCKGNLEIEHALALLVNCSQHTRSQDWDASVIQVMQDRLDSLQGVSFPPQPVHQKRAEETSTPDLGILPLGWKRAGKSWQPRPIGAFKHRMIASPHSVIK